MNPPPTNLEDDLRKDLRTIKDLTKTIHGFQSNPRHPPHIKSQFTQVDHKDTLSIIINHLKLPFPAMPSLLVTKRFAHSFISYCFQSLLYFFIDLT